MTISVALFDLDDTLFAHRHAVDTGIVAHLSSLFPHVDRDAEARRWHELEELHYPRYLSGELDLFAQRRVRSRALVAPYGVELPTDGEADAWYDSYYRHYVHAWTLHHDALTCLDALDAAGVRVGVITNGDPGFQGEKLQAVGLADRLDHVVASGSLGFAKPDARIFAHACAAFDVQPSAALYVGDRLRTDAIGAADAGLLGVWLNRGGQSSADDDVAVAASGVRVISTLAEVPGIIAANRR